MEGFLYKIHIMHLIIFNFAKQFILAEITYLFPDRLLFKLGESY